MNNSEYKNIDDFIIDRDFISWFNKNIEIKIDFSEFQDKNLPTVATISFKKILLPNFLIHGILIMRFYVIIVFLLVICLVNFISSVPVLDSAPIDERSRSTEQRIDGPIAQFTENQDPSFYDDPLHGNLLNNNIMNV